MHAKTQKKQDTVANNRKKKETNRAFARAGRAEGERGRGANDTCLEGNAGRDHTFRSY